MFDSDCWAQECSDRSDVCNGWTFLCRIVALLTFHDYGSGNRGENGEPLHFAYYLKAQTMWKSGISELDLKIKIFKIHRLEEEFLCRRNQQMVFKTQKRKNL